MIKKKTHRIVIHAALLTAVTCVLTVCGPTQAQDKTIRIEFSPQVDDYAPVVQKALNEVYDAGGGKVEVAYGIYPLKTTMSFRREEAKTVDISLVGLKNPAGERPQFYCDSEPGKTHRMMMFRAGYLPKSALSVSVSGLEIVGNNVPVNRSTSNVPGNDGGSIENNQIVNDLKHTRWIGRCGVVLERNSEKVKVLNNTVSGYCRNVHIELTFGGHEVVGNKLLATDLAIILNEPDRLRPLTAMPFTEPVLIQNNVIEYAQERERYGIHPFGGPRSFIYIDQYRSNLALDGSKILDNKFTYRSHKGVKVNRWREYDVRHKTQHLYIRNQYIINNWLERGNKFN